MRWFFYVFSLTRNVFLLAVAVALIHLYVGSIFIVQGLSMLPTLEGGEILLVNKLAYLASTPHRGDIVILKYPGDPVRRKFVKRIVALPNEKIEIQNGRLFVNGKLLTEAYLDPQVFTEPDLSTKLQADEYYTLGDNRPNSSDSRVFGGTPVRFLIGSARLKIWPLAEFGYISEVFY